MDIRQFNQHILSLSDQLYRLARSVLQDSEMARDAVQELNLKLWEKKDVLDKVENIPGFVMRSMRNLCLDSLRKLKITDRLPSEMEFDELNPYQQTELRDLAGRITELIDRLPELQRTIIRMRDVEGMEIAEIAYITSITENAVSVNLSRARQKIRDKIINQQKKTEEKVWKE